MKTFTAFLIEKQLISAEAAVVAMLAHLRSQPPLAALAHAEGLLSLSEQLQALQRQAETGAGYREALQDLGLWREPLVSKLAEAARRSATPIAELLARSGAASLEALNHAFDEYVADAKGKASPATVQGAAAIGLTHGIVGSFLELFDERRYAALESLIGAWEGERSSSLEVGMLAAVAEWEPIRAGAQFVRAGELATLLEAAAKAVTCASGRAAALPPVEVAKLAEVAREVTRLAWSLRQRVGGGQAEPSPDKDLELKARYDAVMAVLRDFEARLVDAA